MAVGLAASRRSTPARGDAWIFETTRRHRQRHRRRDGDARVRGRALGDDARSKASGKTTSGPPRRDSGIADEWEAFEEEDGRDEAETGESSETTTDDESGMRTTKKRGVETGEGGYRSRWWKTKRECPDGRSGSSETRWAKSDFSGYKELGFEKSGFNETGETWWETWREIYSRDDYTGFERIERSADMWARDAQSKEWQEKWWERYYANGAVERGLEKSGREVRQAWWEKWGEQYDGEGATLKWSDKWAEGSGTRWGDKWEERRSKFGSGRKSGETWRVGQDGERFSRTWGEVISPDGSVRKFGTSTTGESWDTTVKENVYFDKNKPPMWEDVLRSSERLMAIKNTAPEENGEHDLTFPET